MKQTQQKQQSEPRTQDRRRLPIRRDRAPVLTFSTYAWLKLQFLCHVGDTEVGGFGITSARDLLYVEDVVTVRQRCSSVSVEFDDEAVADFFDEQVEAGRAPEQFARIWLHTHPGDSPAPSGVDEETFGRVFGRCHWSVMFILARGGQTYCRLRVGATNDGRGVALASPIPVQVDYATLAEIDFDAPLGDWVREFDQNVQVEPDVWATALGKQTAFEGATQRDDFDSEAWVACFEELDPWEQQNILDELGTATPFDKEVDHEE